MGDSYNQIYTFILYSAIVGFFLGALYDVFRIVRMAFSMPELMISEKKGVKPKSPIAVNIVVFICDILFFLISAVVCAIFIFHANDGKIRGIALAGSLAGFIFYYNTVGRLITLISGGIIRLFYTVIGFAALHIILPFLKILRRCILCAVNALSLIVKKAASKLRMSRALRAARRGFE